MAIQDLLDSKDLQGYQFDLAAKVCKPLRRNKSRGDRSNQNCSLKKFNHHPYQFLKNLRTVTPIFHISLGWKLIIRLIRTPSIKIEWASIFPTKTGPGPRLVRFNVKSNYKFTVLGWNSGDSFIAPGDDSYLKIYFPHHSECLRRGLPDGRSGRCSAQLQLDAKEFSFFLNLTVVLSKHVATKAKTGALNWILGFGVLKVTEFKDSGWGNAPKLKVERNATARNLLEAEELEVWNNKIFRHRIPPVAIQGGNPAAGKCPGETKTIKEQPNTSSI